MIVTLAAGLAGDKEKVAVFKQLGITTADLGRGTEAVVIPVYLGRYDLIKVL